MRKPIALLTSLLLTKLTLAAGAGGCLLDLDRVPPKGATQVWSPLFQASWEQLNEMQDGELLKVVPPNALVTTLNQFEWQPQEVMPKDGYAVYAGPATQEFARETATSIKKKFKIEFDAGRVPTIPHGKAAFGILLRDLKFKEKFFRSRKRGLKFRARTGESHMVEFFGTAGSHSGGYDNFVKVLHYEPKASSFILSVATDRENEKLIVYRPHRECSFRVAINRVKEAIESPLSGPYGSLKDGSLHRKDVVKIPYVTLDTETDFSGQLDGNLYYAGETMPWRVVKALQLTKFELFEEGARVRVQTGVGIEPFGDPPEPPPVKPRSFICDQPFYVFLWKQDAGWPYLAAWIDGADSLTPFPE